MSMDAFNVWHLVIIGGPLILCIVAISLYIAPRSRRRQFRRRRLRRLT